MWLLLGSLSTGMAYADLSKNESEIDIVQQTGIISVPLKSGQININQTIPEKGKN